MDRPTVRVCPGLTSGRRLGCWVVLSLSDSSEKERRSVALDSGRSPRSPRDDFAKLLYDIEGRRLNRREVLRRGVMLGLSVPAIGALLAACGSGDDDDDSGDDAGAATSTSSS